MEPLAIDLEELSNALEDHSITWYLDLRDGKVIPLVDDPEINKMTGVHRAEKQPEIFLRITPRPSHEGYAIMEDFTEGLPDGRAKHALLRALGQPKPFRRFKDALYNFPSEQEAWYKFHAARLQEAAIGFLKVNSIAWTKK